MKGEGLKAKSDCSAVLLPSPGRVDPASRGKQNSEPRLPGEFVSTARTFFVGRGDITTPSLPPPTKKNPGYRPGLFHHSWGNGGQLESSLSSFLWAAVLFLKAELDVMAAHRTRRQLDVTAVVKQRDNLKWRCEDSEWLGIFFPLLAFSHTLIHTQTSVLTDNPLPSLQFLGCITLLAG